jgi:hypothetical protein
MNMPIKALLIVVLLFSGSLANAQSNNFSTLTTIGISTPIVDNGNGYHLGINPSYLLSNNFSLEGQLSYLYTKISGSFLSGNEGKSNAVNALVGGRLYLTSAAKPTRLYFNLLVGINYNKEEINSIKGDGMINAGFSAGAFVELKKLVLGLSFDTPQNLVLKVGYVL